MRERTQTWSTPPQPLPELFRQAFDVGEAAISRLAEWGVAVPDDSRLHDALQVVEAIAESRHFPDDLTQRERAVVALRTLLDFGDITRALPLERVATVRRELAIAVQGALVGDEGGRQPHQLQSQYWVAGGLSLAGIEFSQPDLRRKHAQKAPDFLLPNGLTNYGVEVKRPQSERAIAARLQDARDQLDAFGVDGAVVLDLTDCLRTTSAERAASELVRVGDQVNSMIWSETSPGFRPGFARIITASLVARGSWLQLEGPRPLISMGTITYTTTFATSEGNLSFHRAEWLRKSLQQAYKAIGVEIKGRVEPGFWPLPADLQ